ncbi:hypothetical protein RHSIM_Rhsim01G0137700 [Rhododendron simsii]|uniref:Uncharacterized protein n=1 Tax=Rhododendron simsii TaxID=118357 RepID=A0A834HJB1_RHOSS|nr:hypothetical protein RHSIM_Rhsim01G0137700 [Rhododendron simsii]
MPKQKAKEMEKPGGQTIKPTITQRLGGQGSSSSGTPGLSIKEQKAEFKKSLKKKMEEFQQALLEDDDLLSVNSSNMMKEDFKDDKNEVDSQKSTTFGQALDTIQFGKLEADEPISCNWADCVVDDSPLTLKELAMEDLKAAPAKLDDYKAEVKDPLKDFNVGTEGDPKILHVCAALPDEIKDRLKYLLSEFKDCFAWDYPDMPDLNRSLVEHKIPIKKDFVPYQQIPRQMTPEVQREVKKEMERLFKAKFIRPVKYVEWISNIVPVINKNGKVRICIDFRNLNTTSPKMNITCLL